MKKRYFAILVIAVLFLGMVVGYFTAKITHINKSKITQESIM